MLEGDIVIFKDILRAVAELNDEERKLLRHYLEPTSEKPAVLTPKERTRRWMLWHMA